MLHIYKKLITKALSPVRNEIERMRFAVGVQQAFAVRGDTVRGMREAEFRVYSQWGEDGIIQYLLARTKVGPDNFIEFGVEDYSEANTRFLLEKDNWRGLIIDGGEAHLATVERRGLKWRHDVQAVSAFVTRENVNDLFRRHGFEGDIGLLSVDIDGNDYWVLEAIDSVSPRVLIVEYNSTFGPRLAVSVPYDPGFVRSRAHHSNLYYGASLAAICGLAARKGYVFVGCNSAGNNCFFVRRDAALELSEVSPTAGYVVSRFAESRDASGQLTYVRDHRQRLKLIRDLPLVQVESGVQATIASLYGLE